VRYKEEEERVLGDVYIPAQWEEDHKKWVGLFVSFLTFSKVEIMCTSIRPITVN
jgi:hypothetical protein